MTVARFLPWAALTCCALAFDAAAAPRTFVSSTGSDANGCSLSQPCRSFTRALSQTDAGGEILALDSAGYGPVSVGKSVTIQAPRGVYAGISVASGQTGVAVNASGVAVVLRGLSINGTPGSGVGIAFQAGAELRVERCTIDRMGDIGIVGAATGAKLTVSDSTITRSGGGVLASDLDLLVLERVDIAGNVQDGVFVTRNSPGFTRAMIVDGVIANNGGNGVLAFQFATSANVSATIKGTSFVNNADALQTGSEIYFYGTGSGSIVGGVDRATIAGSRGIRVEASGSASVSAEISNNQINDHVATGILAIGAGAHVVATANVIHWGSVGMAGLGGAALYSASDNVLYQNSSPVNGVTAIPKY